MQFSSCVSSSGFPWFEPMLARRLRRARLSKDQFIWSELLPAPFRSRETVSRLSYYAIHAATAHRPLSGRVMHFQFAQYLDLARCNRSASRHERNRTSLSTVILTYRRWIWPFAHGAQQPCPRSRGQDNTISARWNVRVTLFYLGSIGALQNTHRSMR